MHLGELCGSQNERHLSFKTKYQNAWHLENFKRIRAPRFLQTHLVCPWAQQKAISFPTVPPHTRENKEGNLVSKDPFFLLIRNMQLALWKVVFKDLNSSSIRISWRYTNVFENRSFLSATLNTLEHGWLILKPGFAASKVKGCSGSLLVESYLILFLRLP